MLDLKNLEKTFNPHTVHEKKALQNVSLHLEKGDFATIVGSNGAGKSTLFNAISGSFLLDRGSVVLDGQDITFLQEHKRSAFIGRLFQDPLMGTAPHMSIEENLSVSYIRASGLSLFSRVGKKEKAYFREQLSLLGMGLEDRLSHPVGLLSGGQRQALTLLMATMVTPKILLLDEHTAALDPKTAENVLQLTDKLVAEHNLTTLMITHNMRDALRFGNRLIMMDAGRIIYDVKGEEKKQLTVADLLQKFEVAGENALSDRMVLGAK